MTMASGLYGSPFVDTLDATQLPINLIGDTIKALLVLDAYTPNFDTHALLSDVTNQVANGNGYTTGGAALAGKTLAAASGYATFSADNAEWTTATFTARGTVLYDDTVTNDPLWLALTFGADIPVVAGTFRVKWNANVGTNGAIWRAKYNPAA